MSKVLDLCIHKPESTVICVFPLPKCVSYKGHNILNQIHFNLLIFFIEKFSTKNYYKNRLILLIFLLFRFQFTFRQDEMFKKFGKLRYVGLDTRDNCGLVTGFIEFEDASIAEQLIINGHMEIEGKKLQVKPYNEFKQRFRHLTASVLEGSLPLNPRKRQFRQRVTFLETSLPTDPLLQPPALDSPTNILNILIDDCLREILKKLHFSTLNTVANVCVRFNRVAKEAFHSKYQSEQINILDLEWHRQPTIATVEDFLRNFGASISSISTLKQCSSRYYMRIFENVDDIQLLLKMINTYCTKLNTLELNFARVHDETLQETRALFRRLTNCRLENVRNGSIFDIISACSKLKRLEISFSTCDDEYFILPKIPCPKLIEVRFSRLDPRLSYVVFKFLELNTKLKTLKIDSICMDELVNIIKGLSQLNELTLNFVSSRALSPHVIDTLRSHKAIKNLHMKSISFHCDIDTMNTVSKLKNIVTFKLSTYGINNVNLINILKQMPNIETLYFDQTSRDEGFDTISKSKTVIVQTILQHTNQLKQLFIKWHNKKGDRIREYPINVANYYEILESVKSRINGIKLTIEFNVSGAILANKYSSETSSIYILNMVPHLLSIQQRLYGYRSYY